MAFKKFTQAGKVLSVNGRVVSVGFSAKGACAGCQARSKCGMVDSSTRQVDVVVANGDKYEVGQDVEVAISYEMGVLSVVIAYIIPLIILMAVLCGTISFGVNEGGAALISLVTVAIYYAIVYIFRLKLDKQIKFTIE